MQMNKKNLFLLFLIVFGSLLIGCKSSSLKEPAPFNIVEKTYFYWVGGKQGTQGTTIRLKGQTDKLNLSFSKVYFQNHEYSIVPNFNSNGFVIEGNYSYFREKDLILDKDPAAEYGNSPSNPTEKIPFDLKENEAILVYSVNGREGYYKISDIKQLEKVFMP